MNREQIQEAYLKLLNEKIDKENEIIKDAKTRGIWKEGLDSNEELFAELKAEFERKVKELKEQLDN